MQRKRRLERIAEYVVEIEVGEAIAVGKAVRMHHDECPEMFGPCKEGAEFWIRQFLAIDIGQDFDALQFQILHHVIELADREFWLLQGDDAEPDKAVGLARAIFRYAIVGETMRRLGDIWIDRVITLRRRRRHD